MKTKVLRASIASGVLACLTYANCVLADSIPTPVRDSVVALVGLFGQGALSARSAVSALGSDATIDGHNGIWEVTSKLHGLKCVVRGLDQEAATDLADIYIDRQTGLVLEDLKRVFGPWKQVYASKTSSVSFRIQSKQLSDETIVFAKLFTPKPTANSPVVSVALRRMQKQ